MDAQHHPKEAIDTLQLLADHRQREVVHTGAAIRGWQADPQEAEPAHLLQHRANMCTVLRPLAMLGASAIPGADMWGDLLLSEVAYGFTEQFVLLSQEHVVVGGEIHVCAPFYVAGCVSRIARSPVLVFGLWSSIFCILH